MSPRREKSKKGFWRRLLIDPWRKLIALAMATGLWFFLDSQITDTYPLDLRLELVDRDTTESSQDPTLDVRVPRRAEYTVIGFEDINGQRRDHVRLVFEGSKHLMRRIRDERPRFYMRPSQLDLRGDQPTFQIDTSKIEPYNRDFDRLLVEIQPSLIMVKLERNATSAPIFPSLAKTDILGLNREVNLRTRLELDRIRFEPTSGVQLTGTQRSIEAAQKQDKLFEVDLGEFVNPTQAELRVPLQLRASLLEDGVRMSPRIATAIIPVKPRFKEFTLRNVPVYVHTQRTGRAPGEYVAEPDRVDVVIKAVGTLEVELSTTADQEEWVQNNVYVLASLRDAAGAQDIAAPVLCFVEPRWVLDKDYQVDPIGNVTVKPKQDG